MTAKEYLSQAYRLDEQINSKIEQLDSLNALATKATAVLTGMPHSPNRGKSNLEDTICKIIDLQSEINADIDRYVDLKQDIAEKVAAVENTDLRLLLEKRYLKGEKWEEIAVELGYDLRWVHRLHVKALTQVQEILSKN